VTCGYCILQDEKNQMLVVNVWINLVHVLLSSYILETKLKDLYMNTLTQFMCICVSCLIRLFPGK